MSKYKEYDYEIFSDGYDITKDGAPVVTQREPYARVYKKDGSYEENAKAQIDSFATDDEKVADIEKIRADIDYLAMELGVDLDI